LIIPLLKVKAEREAFRLPSCDVTCLGTWRLLPGTPPGPPRPIGTPRQRNRLLATDIRNPTRPRDRWTIAQPGSVASCSSCVMERPGEAWEALLLPNRPCDR